MQQCQACFLDDWWPVLPSNSPPSSQGFSCRVAKGFQFCASRLLNFPLLPIHSPVVVSSTNCLWHFCNIQVYMISSRDFSLTLSLHIRLCSFLFPFLFKLLPSYWHFCSSFSRPRHVSAERGTHLLLCNFDSAIFFSSVYSRIELKSFTHAGHQLHRLFIMHGC